MSRFRPTIASACILILALFPLGPARSDSVSLPLDEQRKILHASNRLSFGGRPGDVERIKAIGLDRWIAEQLQPESIDDHELEARLGALRTLRMSVAELAQGTCSPASIR